ncbi:hypothetical protein BDZ89DRAFT_1164235 [Hymenopellis radicata]|nr:hypothetical protein BDZ89DRAFT_1164235 [Hymenopellis radicata]
MPFSRGQFMETAVRYAANITTAELIRWHIFSIGLLIERLERNWGLEKETFFLHSRSNMFILRPNCHADLDSDFTKLTLKKRAQKPANELFEFDQDNPIKHRLICLDWPENYPLPVYVVGKNDKVKIKALYPPFNQRLLTHIELHVNPFYLIWNLGRKLVSLDPRSLDVPPRIIDDLFRVRKLFLAWRADPPPEELRRSKRVRTASTAKETSAVAPPDAKRARSSRSGAASSRQ